MEDKNKWRKAIVTSSVFLLIVVGLSQANPSSSSWTSVLPPLTAIYLAILTHRLLLSLGSAILMGGFLSARSSTQNGLEHTWGFVQNALADELNILLLAFVAPVMVMITVMLVSGGFQGILRRMIRFSKGHRSAQIITSLAGLGIFFDEYANTMIVGSAMRPITDQNKISREKLAFLVDATGAPIAGLAFISTWIGYEVGLFNQVSNSLALGQQGYSMFFDALGFRFYCYLMILFVLINVFSGKDFGPMAKAQERAKDGDLLHKDAKLLTSDTASAEPHAFAQISALSAVLPLAVVFGLILGGIWVDGGGIDLILNQSPLALLQPSSWREAFSRSENGAFVLATAAVTGLATAIACGFWIARLPGSVLLRAITKGLRASLLPMMVMILAWSLRGVCDSLQTGTFLIQVLGEQIPKEIYPATLFICAALTSFSIGTSWGTMAVLIPTAIPLAYQLDGQVYGLTTIICLGAILDGAIFGDHCSPISDTTIMSSLSTQCDHIAHVRTQLPYALVVGLTAILLGYLPAGWGIPSLFSLIAGAAVFLLIFFPINKTDQSQLEPIYDA